jgi:hypothetical protein
LSDFFNFFAASRTAPCASAIFSQRSRSSLRGAKIPLDASDHLHTGVAELPSDELIRRAGGHKPHGIEMPRVTQSMVRESEWLESIAMRVADLPARQPTE